MPFQVLRVQVAGRAAAVAVVGAIVASACGARSSLSVGAGAGNGGAATSAASASTGAGAGGAGGAPLIGPPTTCGMVAQATAILTVDAPEDGNALQPSLVVLPQSTPPAAAVAYVWQPSVPGAYTVARVASFDGWGTWPPPTPKYADVQNTETVQSVSGITLLAQTDPTMGPAGFDLLFAPVPVEDENFNDEPSLFYDTGLDGSNPLIQGTLSGTLDFLVTGASAQQAWPGTTNVLTGVSRPVPFSSPPLYALIGFAGPNEGGMNYWMACSTTPIAADAVPDDAGWLIAAGVGNPLGWVSQFPQEDCATSLSSAVGPGTELTLGKLDPSMWDDQWLKKTKVVLQAASPITRIRMANRSSGGTWIVWSLDGAPTLTAGVVSGALTLSTTFPIAAAGGTLVPTSFALEPFGAELVVAAVDQMAGSNDQVQVAAIDDSGATTWAATVQTEGSVEGAVSLRAAPDGSSLLLAWSELPPGGTTHRIRVARLDCSTCAADGAACTAASDCCGARCDHGTCATPATLNGLACTSTAECPDTTTCDPTVGMCVGWPLCNSDADCTDASLCEPALSACLFGGNACTKDTDCLPGQRCKPHNGGVCAPGTCTAKGGSCASDHECCGLACDTASGSCM